MEMEGFVMSAACFANAHRTSCDKRCDIITNPALWVVELEGFVMSVACFANAHRTSCDKRCAIITNPALWVVELEGFEPSSKRGTNELSTCLVST